MRGVTCDVPSNTMMQEHGDDCLLTRGRNLRHCSFARSCERVMMNALLTVLMVVAVAMLMAVAMTVLLSTNALSRHTCKGNI